MMRKRCGTCNSLRDCCCKGRERGVVLVKAARIPEHEHTLSAEGRRAAAKREQQQAVQQHGAVGSGEYRPPVRSGAHWPTEVFHAQPNVLALRKEKENAGSMKHLTAEGRRAAQMRLPKAEQQPRAQGSGPRRPAGPVPVEHESVRLRHLEQQQTMSDAEKTRAEQRARQEKFALEQQQVRPLASCRPLLLASPASSPVNTELLHRFRLPCHSGRDRPAEDAACDSYRSGLLRCECRARAPNRLQTIWSSRQLHLLGRLRLRGAGQAIRNTAQL